MKSVAGIDQWDMQKVFKIILILLLLFVVSFFGLYLLGSRKSANTFPQRDSIKNDSYSKYTHPILGYSITIPENYHTAENYWGKNSFILWSGPSHKGFPSFGYPFVGIQVDSAKGKTLEGIINELERNINKIDILNKIILKNGREAYLIEFMDINQNTKDTFKNRDIYTVKDGNLYRIGVRALVTDWEKEGESWKKIIDSFEI